MLLININLGTQANSVEISFKRDCLCLLQINWLENRYPPFNVSQDENVLIDIASSSKMSHVSQTMSVLINIVQRLICSLKFVLLLFLSPIIKNVFECQMQKKKTTVRTTF